jgi:cystathionine beta-lyase/cystathionine gamma-synthase
MMMEFETRAIHVGQEPDPSTGAVIPPIVLSTTYAQSEVGVHKGFDYSRTDNPTRSALQSCVSSLEGAAYGLAFASGMAAEDTVFRLANPDDHIIIPDDAYGGTYRLVARVLAPQGYEFTPVNLADASALEAAWQPNTRIVLLETPTNPLLKIVDIAAVARVCRERGARLVVDNTFATPYLQQPLALGADIVVHSATKYLGGHSDVVGGFLATSDLEDYQQLKFLQNAVGAVPGPLDCYLVLRGVKTLAIRMERHCANARQVVDMLAAHPAVERVLYPGLPTHPGYEVAAKQMREPGGMVSFIARGGEAAALEIVTHTKLFTLAESLGAVESLIEHPAKMTHASVEGSPLAVDPALVRLSVGIEHASDLVADLRQALDAVT